jgi:hypothetical protein
MEPYHILVEKGHFLTPETPKMVKNGQKTPILGSKMVQKGQKLTCSRTTVAQKKLKIRWGSARKISLNQKSHFFGTFTHFGFSGVQK